MPPVSLDGNGELIYFEHPQQPGAPRQLTPGVNLGESFQGAVEAVGPRIHGGVPGQLAFRPGPSQHQPAPLSPSAVPAGDLSARGGVSPCHPTVAPPAYECASCALRRDRPDDPEAMSRMEGAINEIRAMLRSCPTRQEFDTLATKKELAETSKQLGSSLRSEVSDIQASFATVNERLAALEEEKINWNRQRDQWEEFRREANQREVSLRLRVDDLENRGRRNNIRIRGVPEEVREAEIQEATQAILNMVRDMPAETEIEIDRAHRVAGPVSDDPARPRDIICRVHFFKVKDAIMRLAWRKRSVRFRGADVILLSDLTRDTLTMRRTLKPVLDLVLQQGGTYRWGYPFRLVVRKDSEKFVLEDPDQLPDLFGFLGSSPIQVENWLSGVGWELRDPDPWGDKE